MFKFERLLSASKSLINWIINIHMFAYAYASLIWVYIKSRCAKLRTAPFCVSLFVMLFSLSAGTSAHAQAGPFTCDGDIFQVQSGQLRIFDPIVSAYVDVGAQNGAYNATGFNIQDNFAYGSQGSNVIRIHSDGFIETLFNVGFSSFSGDVDDNNTLWLRRASNRYIGINLANGSVVQDITFLSLIHI